MPSKNTNNEVASIPELPTELLALLNNPEDVATAETFEALAASVGVDDTDIISAWQQVKDKSELVNRPFYVRYWKILESRDFVGNDYVVVFASTYDGAHIFFSDGSQGVARQLKEVTEKRLREGRYDSDNSGEFLKVPNGLRMSEYDLDRNGNVTRDASEKFSIGRTFYLA